MTTFDHILPVVSQVLATHKTVLSSLDWILINRDLNGKVRLIVPDTVQKTYSARRQVEAITTHLVQRLGAHAYPLESSILYEQDRMFACDGTASFPLEGFENVLVVDRLATEGNWASIAPVTTGVPRVVFFSIKGGVGRSTALAASAFALAQAGKRVLVLDLDLESPGLSSALLPNERRPTFGIADWLVEDLVDNGDAVLEEMLVTSTLSHDGEIYVVPAHGRDAGEYVAKLGRVWMPKIGANGVRQNWSQRLGRLIDTFEQRWNPDVILIDSRAGIDEVASSCVTDLGAGLVLLFAIDGEQTWSGYQILFRHWHRSGVVRDIRERLQIVGAMIPELDSIDYFASLREHAADQFTDELYDEVPPGEATGDCWNFDETDESAPHYPWAIQWHRSFAALRSLHSRLEAVDMKEVSAIFGSLIDGLQRSITGEGQT